MARRISIVCGVSEIDGYAFGFSIDVLSQMQADPWRRGLPVNSVNRLLQEASFRPHAASEDLNPAITGLRPLRELLDRYHTHSATKLHVKIYALLGMCSDDLDHTGLRPDYSLPWEELSQRLYKWMFGKSSSTVGHHSGAETVQCRGLILGIISSRSASSTEDNFIATVNSSHVPELRIQAICFRTSENILFARVTSFVS